MTNKRVLVADDSEAIREMLGSFLANLGYHTDLADDGQAAVNHFKSHPYDVIICDLQMPRLDGLGLARLIRADDRFETLPIIALSALADEEEIAKGLEAGITEYQVKLNRDEFQESIRRVLGREHEPVMSNQ